MYTGKVSHRRIKNDFLNQKQLKHLEEIVGYGFIQNNF